MTDGPLVIAVPSKGRLQDNAAAFFARAGLPLTQARGLRDYRAALGGVADVEVLFLSAAEIVAQLARGGAHLGISGEDLVREEIADADSVVELLAPLGFGHANVVVAVPQAWIDVRTMADLDEVAVDLRARHGRKMRVATKYGNLTRRFFAERGVADYRIVESLGATEGAPASGAAELIVDITTTGATLAANALARPRRRHHPALGGQSRRLAQGPVGRAGKERGRHRARPHRRRGGGAHDARDPRHHRRTGRRPRRARRAS